jgi:hypothetical protein
MLLSSQNPTATSLKHPPPKLLWRERRFSGALNEESERLHLSKIMNFKNPQLYIEFNFLWVIYL